MPIIMKAWIFLLKLSLKRSKVFYLGWNGEGTFKLILNQKQRTDYPESYVVKGNAAVLLNRNSFIIKKELDLAGNFKFEKIQIDYLIIYFRWETKLLHFSKNLEKSMILLLKSIIIYTLQVRDQVSHMISVKYKKLKLIMVHLFRPISWAIEIPFHKLIIFCIIIITTNLNH